MPTPFMHLQVSEALRELAAAAPDPGGGLEVIFKAQWPAFYLGSIAPDYQTICGIPRAETHFYGMPPESRQQGRRALLARYPELYPGAAIPAAQAAFVAAYLVHLRMDLDWHFDVILPYFAGETVAADMRQRYLVHLILLSHLDDLALAALPRTAAGDLTAAGGSQWLPFIDPASLFSWREYLVEQLLPGGKSRTVEIFAGRLHMAPQEFAAKLNDREWMSNKLYSKLPVPDIQRFLGHAIPGYLRLIEDYWAGRFE